MTHEVRVLCSCPDIENCRMELYVSDVRLLAAKYRELLDSIWESWERTKRTLEAA